jgi:hypothetical protein
VAAIAYAPVQAAVEGLARKVFDDTYVRYKAQLGSRCRWKFSSRRT